MSETPVSTKSLVMFPYRGYKPDGNLERLFWKLIEVIRDTTNDPRPTVVLNRDTEISGTAKAFTEDARTKDLDVQRVWSVDTCQMWLAGWGYVIDNLEQYDRIVQVPGDIVAVHDEIAFFAALEVFLSLGEGCELAVGDFSSDTKFSSKDLIDQYGTYVLLANWFPSFTKALLRMQLNRPRSEFLNLKIATLRHLLTFKKFAYEQTLELLFRSWDFERQKWKHRITRHVLGTLRDEDAFRQYRGTLDQIERTERILKLLWREMNQPQELSDLAAVQRFLDEYQRLDRISSSSRETAAVTIRSLLGIASTQV